MKYDYKTLPFPDKRGRFVKQPLVEIEIFGQNCSRKGMALIDSGADRSVFNIEVAKILGIDLSKAPKDGVRGIFGEKEVSVTEVEIKIQHLENKFKIPVSFIDSPFVGLLLGEEGFFDIHRIKFEKDHDTFEINPVKKK